MSEKHRHIEVACAIIERNGLVLAARRSRTMAMPLKWEFPGGKIAPGESPEECLQRELREELGVEITVKRVMPPHTHRYPAFCVTLHPFVCTIASGEVSLQEHDAVLWLAPDALPSLDWAEADGPVISAYRRSLSEPLSRTFAPPVRDTGCGS